MATLDAREALAKILTQQPAFGFTNNNRLQAADVIITELEAVGYDITPKPIGARLLRDARINTCGSAEDKE